MTEIRWPELTSIPERLSVMCKVNVTVWAARVTSTLGGANDSPTNCGGTVSDWASTGATDATTTTIKPVKRRFICALQSGIGRSYKLGDVVRFHFL